MKRIAFICKKGLGNFLHDIMANLKNDYEIKYFPVQNGSRINEAIEWADIIWFEWCDEVAVLGTHNYMDELKNKRVIIRLHRYEAFTNMPQDVIWKSVDRLILVATHIKEILKMTAPDIEDKVKIKVIYNGVELDRFKFQERKPGFDIAWISYINHRKNPVLALQIIERLVRIDSKYKLHIAGLFQDWHCKIYLDYMIKEMQFENNVIFHGWINDINDWLQDKNFLLSTSIHEAHPYNIMEAMAVGIKPVIHNFPGAKELYREQWLFNTVSEAAGIISDKFIDRYNSEIYRKYVIEKGWILQEQIKQIKEVIEEIK